MFDKEIELAKLQAKISDANSKQFTFLAIAFSMYFSFGAITVAIGSLSVLSILVVGVLVVGVAWFTGHIMNDRKKLREKHRKEFEGLYYGIPIKY